MPERIKSRSLNTFTTMYGTEVRFGILDFTDSLEIPQIAWILGNFKNILQAYFVL